ncbi:MAG TPA: hypothetical protein VHI31_02190 [Actinomycetota bacterium]|nr:hypothetical protein [Actinomycetota bacterium]
MCALLLAVLLLAACGSGGTGGDAETPPARPTPEPTETPPATASPEVEPAASPAAPSPGAPPNARSVDVAQFLRPGTSRVAVVYGEMNGVAPEEIVVHSRSNQPGPGGVSPQEYVDAYSWNPGTAAWTKVFDAATYADMPNAGGRVLEPGEGFSQAIVEPFTMVDFAADGTSELVLTVANSGASAGAVAVWVFSWQSESFTTEFTEATERGGAVTLNPDRTLTLEAGEYAPNDPGCCPSGIRTVTIGYNRNTRRIGVLKTLLLPNPDA